MALQSVAVGRRFGRLLVVGLGERNGTVYLDRVLCECGTQKTVRRSDLQSGRTTSCGCARKENASRVGAATRKHGQSGKPLYQLWHNMVNRCHNTKHAAYRYYGARGIKVCDRWRESFDAFAADVAPRPVGLELDRINPDGDYEPRNVRWINRRMQKLNRCQRSPRYEPRPVEWNGQIYAISDLAAIAETSYSAMYNRLMKGMTVEAAIAPRGRKP